MKTKRLRLLLLTALALAAPTICPIASAQTDISPMPAPTAVLSPASSPQMQGMDGMDKMSDSVTKMSEMCQMMMKNEMATMHYKVSAGIAFGVILSIDLLFLAVLEIQWIIYWSRKLRSERG